MHRLLCIWIRRRSATRPQAYHGLAGICVPATLMGFHRPSQCCACPRRSGCLHPGIPTCRLPPRSPRPQCLFLPRDRPATPYPEPAGQSRSCSPASGFSHRGQSVPDRRVVVSGQDCPGLCPLAGFRDRSASPGTSSCQRREPRRPALESRIDHRCRTILTSIRS